MGWASRHIDALKAGREVSFRPRGSSMSGRVESGQLCRVVPVDPAVLRVGDVVLCAVRGRQYLHMIRAVRDGRFLISNNRNMINGWTPASKIYGRLAEVSD